MKQSLLKHTYVFGGHVLFSITAETALHQAGYKLTVTEGVIITSIWLLIAIIYTIFKSKTPKGGANE